MKERTKKIWKAVSSVIIGIFVFLAVVMVGVRIFGVEIYSVLSPSMYPSYPTGSLVYVLPTDPSEIGVGDVITFRIPNGTATHRVIELVEEDGETLYRTQGDNNDDPDGALVRGEKIVGRVVFGLPLLGYLAVFIQQPPGTYIAICVAVAFIVGVIMIDVATAEDKKGNHHNEEA